VSNEHTPPSSSANRPRHAEVVPSFILPSIKKPLTSWNGSIAQHELLRWERSDDLTESTRDHLRAQIIKRLRSCAQELWVAPIKVNLVPNWADRLRPGERKLFEQFVLPLVVDESPLQLLTLRVVKEAVHLPLDRLLSILARMEATYWVPPDTPKTSANSVARAAAVVGVPAQRVTVELTESLRKLGAEVLSWAWVKKVLADDLRFNAPEGVIPHEWIAKQLDLHSADAELPPLLYGLAAAHKLTAAEEARAICAKAAALSLPPRSHDSASRLADILMWRHISAEGPGMTLQEVGSKLGVTRERIRQLCERMEEVVKDTPIATPSLDRVIHALVRIAPVGVVESNQQLAGFIGEGAGVEALLSWAELLGHKPLPIRIDRPIGRLRGELVDVKMVELTDAANWMTSALRYAARDCSSVGCTNFIRVAGMLALREMIAPGQEALESVLREASGFRWLDKDVGWFTLSDTTSSGAANRVRKIMAIAQEAVGADSISAALASDDLWIYRDGVAAKAIPPVHVLRELFLGWDFMQVVQKGRFIARAGVDLTDALSESEKVAVSVIESGNGVACRFEISEAIISKLALSNELVSAMLGSSPIILKIEHGLYALIGRRVGNEALVAARDRVRERQTPGAPRPRGLEAGEYALHISEAQLRHEQHRVDRRHVKRLAGMSHLVRNRAGQVVGAARVNASGAMTGLNTLFPGLKPGDHLYVLVQDDGLRVRHLPNDASRFDIASEAGDDDLSEESY